MAEYFTETSSQQVHQKSRAMLHREVEQATKGLTDIPPVIENSVEGDPAHVLPELARDAAMLVVGRQRGGLAQQALLGSVSAVCVRQATCPVVVIPTVAPQRSTHEASRIAGNLLVMVSGSEIDRLVRDAAEVRPAGAGPASR